MNDLDHKKNKSILKYSLLISLFLLASSLIFFLFYNKESSQMDKPDLETAKIMALQSAEKHVLITFTPYSATEAGFGTAHVPQEHFLHDDFKDYHFVYVWSQLAHTENSPFAISPDGSVYKLPEEFNQLILNRNLQLNSKAEGLELIKFYLVFTALIPGTDRQIILNEIYDIPGINQQEDENINLVDLISKPNIEDNENAWEYSFFTWRAVGGKIFQWQIKLSKNGTIFDLEKRELANMAGDYITIE